MTTIPSVHRSTFGMRCAHCNTALIAPEWTERGGPALRDRMAAWLRWILGSITPPISPRLPA